MTSLDTPQPPCESLAQLPPSLVRSDPDTARLEIQPLDTLDQLLRWDETIDCEAVSLCAAHKPLPTARDGGLDATRPRFLACHDMRGGYLEDRYLEGDANVEAYIFRHWHAIDGFVYFSHRLVTIPPPGWSDAAHLHGVPILGTFITEWDAGGLACKQLLSDDSTLVRAAQQLTKLAMLLRFDGWVINIENELPAELVAPMVRFLRALTESMHANVHPGSKVIWYDAVTTQGVLDWQNELNDNNIDFFQACDGIWLNYTWTTDQLRASAQRARNMPVQGAEPRSMPPQCSREITTHRSATRDRRWDVYAGIDAFGRGVLGGGGMQCHVAVAAVRSMNLSTALFACGWACESQEPPVRQPAEAKRIALAGPVCHSDLNCDHTAADAYVRERFVAMLPHSWYLQHEEFWRRILAAWGVCRATVCRLPTKTDFCMGAGYATSTSLPFCRRASVENGTCCSRHAFYNLRMQSLQPALLYDPGCDDECTRAEGQPHDRCFQHRHHHHHQHRPRASLSYLTAVPGGHGSVRIYGMMTQDVMTPQVISLFKARVSFPASGLNVIWTTATRDNTVLRLRLKFETSVSVYDMHAMTGSSICKCNVELGGQAKTESMCLLPDSTVVKTPTHVSESAPVVVAEGETILLSSEQTKIGSMHWTTRRYALCLDDFPRGQRKGGCEWMLTSIDAVVAASTDVAIEHERNSHPVCDALIGEMALFTRGHQSCEEPLVASA